MNLIAQNFKDIKSRIADAAKDCGRDTDSITLVAVTKLQPPEKIAAALEAGHRVFGENKVQEAQSRWADWRKNYPDLKLRLIGPLQTNKAADAVALFDVIETLDREKLADALAHEMQKQGRRLPCLIQVNTGEEPQKAGVMPGGLENLYRYAVDRAGLDVTGLMCIPPVAESAIFHFGLLATLARRLSLPHASMGMSADFEDAIRLGATHVRVGSSLFGERKD